MMLIASVAINIYLLVNLFKSNTHNKQPKIAPKGTKASIFINEKYI